jgi:hypothetical protein
MLRRLWTSAKALAAAAIGRRQAPGYVFFLNFKLFLSINLMTASGTVGPPPTSRRMASWTRTRSRCSEGPGRAFERATQRV